MIVIDLTHPWNVLESLERWTQVVSKHVNSLKISEKQRRRMEDKSKYHNNSCFYGFILECLTIIIKIFNISFINGQIN